MKSCAGLVVFREMNRFKCGMHDLFEAWVMLIPEFVSVSEALHLSSCKNLNCSTQGGKITTVFLKKAFAINTEILSDVKSASDVGLEFD